MEDPVVDLETRAAQFHKGADDVEVVAVSRRLAEFRLRIDHGPADQMIAGDHLTLAQPARRFDQMRRAGVEHFEIAGIIDDARRVAVTPFDSYRPAIFLHGAAPLLIGHGLSLVEQPP